MSTATGQPRRVGGVLLVYHRPTRHQFVDAANVGENIAAFGRHSGFQIHELNTDLGTPPNLGRLQFDAVLLHYSVFIPGPQGYLMDDALLEYLSTVRGYKVATFQDEYHWCRMRFDFIDRFEIDCVYTMLEPPYADDVYRRHTKASKVVSNYPAYVGDELLDLAARFSRPERERPIDIGYRGRPMPPYMGRGAQEKREIGERFATLAAGSGLELDIGVHEEDRLYGDDWNRFIGASKGTLGVESGVSCFDLEDEVRAEYERLSADDREVTLEELERGALGRWDWRIPYRTVSPRNFEAAAFRICQILYEGHYSGALEPMRHYIPLRKDFSNLDEVIEHFKDEELRATLVENAYRDLIASDEYGYGRLVEGFDRVLMEAGLRPERHKAEAVAAGRVLRRSWRIRLRHWLEARRNWLMTEHRAVWRAIWALSRPVVVPLRLLRRASGGS